MKKAIVFFIFVLFTFSMFAEKEVLYQKQHKSYDNITVVSLIKEAEDWYYIVFVIAENKDAVERYMIYDTSLKSIQDLLFLFEKEKDYKYRIQEMEQKNSLLCIHEDTSIVEGILMKTKSYCHMY